MKTKKTIKIPLTNLRKEELKLFFLISRPIKLDIANEKVELVLDFNLEGVMKNLKLPQGFTAAYKGSLTISQLLEKIQLENKVSVGNESKVIDQPAKKKMNKKQFKNSLMLVADKFVKKAKDKKVIKKIIKEL